MLKHSISFEAIGTQWSIETDALLPADLVTEIHILVEDFDVTYSRFRNDSLVSKVSKQAGTYTFPEGAVALFDFYKNMYDLTDGKVTPLIGNMLERSGYDAAYSFISSQQKILPAWDEALEWKGNILIAKEPVVLDVGAAGKGYLVDMVCELLDEAGTAEYIVDASGDLRQKGTAENKVGLEDPRDPSKVIGVIDVQDKSLCASATNRRRWGKDQHHIFDPDLMKPTQDIAATWVIADTAMIADGIATSLFFAEPEILRKTFEFDFVRMHMNGAIDYSPAFEGKLF